MPAKDDINAPQLLYEADSVAAYLTRNGTLVSDEIVKKILALRGIPEGYRDNSQAFADLQKELSSTIQSSILPVTLAEVLDWREAYDFKYAKTSATEWRAKTYLAQSSVWLERLFQFSYIAFLLVVCVLCISLISYLSGFKNDILIQLKVLSEENSSSIRLLERNTREDLEDILQLKEVTKTGSSAQAANADSVVKTPNQTDQDSVALSALLRNLFNDAILLRDQTNAAYEAQKKLYDIDQSFFVTKAQSYFGNFYNKPAYTKPPDMSKISVAAKLQSAFLEVRSQFARIVNAMLPTVVFPRNMAHSQTQTVETVLQPHFDAQKVLAKFVNPKGNVAFGTPNSYTESLGTQMNIYASRVEAIDSQLGFGSRTKTLIERAEKNIELAGAWFLPAVWGILGAVLFNIRSLLDHMRPNPRFARALLRILLGGLAGFLAAQMLVPSQLIDAPFAGSAGLYLLAFTVGYSVHVLFNFLDRIAFAANRAISMIGNPKNESSIPAKT
jgi:hypothetical protein